MEGPQKPKGMFYGWVIVLSGTVIMASVMGIIYNCFSQFIKPVCEDMGFTRQAMSMNQTLVSLIQVLVSLFWGRILQKVRLKNLMLCWAVIGPAAYFCYSFATQMWMFYLISMIMSITMCMLTILPFSYMLSNWFVEKKGLATGVCFMGSGIGGMIFNPLLSMWLEQYGWRTSFRILAVIMAVTAIPCVLLVRARPEEMGLKALGYEKAAAAGQTQEDGYTLAEAKRLPRFWVLVSCSIMINMGISSLVQTLSPHLTDNGYTASFAAIMVSVSMGAMALGKMALGQLFDMLGTKKAAIFSISCGLLGLIGMLFCQVKPMLLLIILGIGFGCSFGNVGNPIVVQNVFGKKDFAAIMGLFTACSNIGGSISPTANGTAFDIFGSYRPAFMVWAAMLSIVIVCFTIFLPSNKKTAAKAE